MAGVPENGVHASLNDHFRLGQPVKAKHLLIHVSQNGIELYEGQIYQKTLELQETHVFLLNGFTLFYHVLPCFTNLLSIIL